MCFPLNREILVLQLPSLQIKIPWLSDGVFITCLTMNKLNKYDYCL